MKSYAALPQGYCHTPAAAIDLVHNKKQFWIVNGLSVVLCVIMWVLPALWGYSLLDFNGEESLSAYFLRVGIAIVGLLAYIALHELTHGAAMKLALCGVLGWPRDVVGTLGVFDNCQWCSIELPAGRAVAKLKSYGRGDFATTEAVG